MPAKLKEPFLGRWIVDEASGCWNWTGAVRHHGYGCLRYEGKQVAAHRFSYERFRRPIPEGLCLLHRCDNPRCINPDHLRPGTQAENLRDMSVKGRACFGEANGQAKLTPEMIAAIRACYQKGSKEFGTPGLAERFGISRVHVWRIVNRKRWPRAEVA